jgi:hypothetical protein
MSIGLVIRRIPMRRGGMLRSGVCDFTKLQLSVDN